MKGCSQRIPVYVSFDGFPRSSSLRKMGYLPALEGSTVPGAAMVNGSKQSLAAADSAVCLESGLWMYVAFRRSARRDWLAPPQRGSVGVVSWGVRVVCMLGVREVWKGDGERMSGGKNAVVDKERGWGGERWLEGGIECVRLRMMALGWKLGDPLVPRRAPRAVALCELGDLLPHLECHLTPAPEHPCRC